MREAPRVLDVKYLTAHLQVQDGKASGNLHQKDAVSVTKVLEKMRDFRKDIKQQLSHIKGEHTNLNQKIAETET